MPVSDDLDVDLDESIGDLFVDLNGYPLSEVAGFETDVDVEFLGEKGRPYFSTVTARFTLTPHRDDAAVDVRMPADDAERVAYELLAAVEEAREEMDDE